MIDADILAWIHGNLSSGTMDAVMKAVTLSGDYAMVWIVAALALIIYEPTRKAGIVMVVAIALGQVLNDYIIKEIVARPRPFVEDPSIVLIISPPSGYSFASGHTVKAFAAAFALFIYERKWGSIALCYAALIGFSRVYLCVHYPSDVVAGAFIGIVCALIAYVAYEKSDKWFEAPSESG